MSFSEGVGAGRVAPCPPFLARVACCPPPHLDQTHASHSDPPPRARRTAHDGSYGPTWLWITMIIFLLCIFVLSLIVIETMALFGRTVRCHMAKVRSRIEHGEDPPRGASAAGRASAGLARFMGYEESSLRSGAAEFGGAGGGDGGESSRSSTRGSSIFADSSRPSPIVVSTPPPGRMPGRGIVRAVVDG